MGSCVDRSVLGAAHFSDLFVMDEDRPDSGAEKVQEHQSDRDQNEVFPRNEKEHPQPERKEEACRDPIPDHHAVSEQEHEPPFQGADPSESERHLHVGERKDPQHEQQQPPPQGGPCGPDDVELGRFRRGRGKGDLNHCGRIEPERINRAITSDPLR